MKQDTDRPLTIVHTEASMGWGGQEIRTFQEARWLRKQRHKVILLAPARSEILARFNKEGFETRTVSFEKKSKWLELPGLISFFRHLKPGVVGTHSSGDSWVALLAARAAHVPVVLRYRHVSAPVRANALNRFLYGRSCDHVLTTAECIREDLMTNLRLAPERVTTVPTGIKPPVFEVSREEARLGLCKRLQLSEDKRFIGCVAVLRSWKGQDILMPAFGAIAEKFPNHELLLVGDGPYRGPLEAKRDELPCRARIHFAGHQDDPWPFFRGLDVAVLPSYKDEGIPQSLLQAMFAECPVVGSEAGGIPEIVLDGETGLLATPRSVSDLGQAIAVSLKSPAETQARAKKALELVQRRHTLDGMGEAVLRIIQDVRRRSIASA